MKVIKVKNQPFDSYMYVVTKDNKNCLIIDLGADFSILKPVLMKENLTPCAVLLTHGHFDHVNGIKSAIDNNIDVYISDKDSHMLLSAEGTLASYVGVNYCPVSCYKTFKEGEYLFGNINVKVLSTPGHTKGSVVFIIDDCMFSGDTIFYDSVGRSDLPSGNINDLKNSINRLIGLHFDYKIYPGHGIETSLYYEIENNYFIKSLNDVKY